ncbi:hypothetical protein B0H10DRAFT_548655 [Mycena sp. CBHHK59/15]|nr:hypothetical protein B0H10DRAFT_548655 [Mycena sp. CBHHK59/15]
MMRSRAPDIIPSGKVIGGRLLDEAATIVDDKLSKILNGQALGAVADGWKSLTKDSVNGVCVNVEYKSYTIELTDATSMDKSGPGMCCQFCDIIDRIEAKYDCKVIYFVTDADGGSKKGRELLGKQRIYLNASSISLNTFIQAANELSSFILCMLSLHHFMPRTKQTRPPRPRRHQSSSSIASTLSTFLELVTRILTGSQTLCISAAQ